jgi:hypothetical protein
LLEKAPLSEMVILQKLIIRVGGMFGHGFQGVTA